MEGDGRISIGEIGWTPDGQMWRSQIGKICAIVSPRDDDKWQWEIVFEGDLQRPLQLECSTTLYGRLSEAGYEAKKALYSISGYPYPEWGLRHDELWGSNEVRVRREPEPVPKFITIEVYLDNLWKCTNL